MAKQPADWRAREWVDDGQGRDRLNTGRPAQIQGRNEREPRMWTNTGERAEAQWYGPDASDDMRAGIGHGPGGGWILWIAFLGGLGLGALILLGLL